MFKRTFNPCDECKYGIDRRDGSGNDAMCKICEFPETTAALAALKEERPLTLTELRQMDGEPVWTVTSGVEGSGRWEIFETSNEKYLRLCNPEDETYDAEADSYGKTWIAYRYKPLAAAPECHKGE